VSEFSVWLLVLDVMTVWALAVPTAATASAMVETDHR
jgi:hypothetical protein